MIRVVHKGDELSTRLAQKISSRLPDSTTDQLLIVCVGGDGTILRAIHEHINELDKAIFLVSKPVTWAFLPITPKSHSMN
jgi:hypothetical protein